MRDIKFRVWDIITKRMIFHDEDTCDRSLMLCFKGDVISEDGEIRNYRFTLMQYTGLKDKSGKEIYEGDIVQEEDTLGEVWIGFGYNNDFGCWYDKRDPISVPTGWFRSDRECEVIGNIYENPELLK